AGRQGSDHGVAGGVGVVDDDFVAGRGRGAAARAVGEVFLEDAHLGFVHGVVVGRVDDVGVVVPFASAGPVGGAEAVGAEVFEESFQHDVPAGVVGRDAEFAEEAAGVAVLEPLHEGFGEVDAAIGVEVLALVAAVLFAVAVGVEVGVGLVDDAIGRVLDVEVGIGGDPLDGAAPVFAGDDDPGVGVNIADAVGAGWGGGGPGVGAHVVGLIGEAVAVDAGAVLGVQGDALPDVFKGRERDGGRADLVAVVAGVVVHIQDDLH